MTDAVNHYPNYPLIGNRYEDKDPRSAGRVIHVLSFATKEGYEIPGKYRVEVLAAPLNPKTVGRKYSILGTTLENEKRYLELTH